LRAEEVGWRKRMVEPQGAVPGIEKFRNLHTDDK